MLVNTIILSKNLLFNINYYNLNNIILLIVLASWGKNKLSPTEIKR
jgi:hypothetical protein